MRKRVEDWLLSTWRSFELMPSSPHRSALSTWPDKVSETRLWPDTIGVAGDTGLFPGVPGPIEVYGGTPDRPSRAESGADATVAEAAWECGCRTVSMALERASN